MNFRPCSLLLVSWLLAANATGDDAIAAKISFHNQDHLGGKLVSIDDESLLWESEVLAQPARFRLADVSELTLPAIMESPDAGHVATITLSNGDIVRGQLMAVTDESIQVETWFAGRLELRRSMVQDIRIEGRSSLFYRGPYNLDGWTQTEGQPWRYENLGLICQKAGGIARNALNADECSTRFTIQRKSENLNLKVIVFSDDLASTTPRSGYELNFQRSSIYLRSGKNRDYIGSNHSPELYQNDQVQVEIRASRKTGQVHLLINSQLVDSWNDDRHGDNAFGPGLHFVANDSQPVRISEIEVAPWNGKIEQTPRQPGMRRQRMFLRGPGGAIQLMQNEQDSGEQEDAEASPNEEQGRMKLANGDSIKGEIKGIQDGIIELTTPLGDILLPIERMRNLQLEHLNTEKAHRPQGDIRATFADGSVMVFRIERISQDQLVGTSQNFGTANFKLSAVTRIEFDIYSLKKLREL